jgi:hypothetical protein
LDGSEKGVSCLFSWRRLLRCDDDFSNMKTVLFIHVEILDSAFFLPVLHGYLRCSLAGLKTSRMCHYSNGSVALTWWYDAFKTRNFPGSE